MPGVHEDKPAWLFFHTHNKGATLPTADRTREREREREREGEIGLPDFAFCAFVAVER